MLQVEKNDKCFQKSTKNHWYKLTFRRFTCFLSELWRGFWFHIEESDIEVYVACIDDDKCFTDLNKTYSEWRALPAKIKSNLLGLPCLLALYQAVKGRFALPYEFDIRFLFDPPRLWNSTFEQNPLIVVPGIRNHDYDLPPLPVLRPVHR